MTVNGCMSSCIIWRGFSRPIFIIIQKSNREEKTDNARTWLYVSVSIEPHICSQSNVDYSLTLPTSHANPLFNPYSQWRLVSLTHRGEFWSTVVSAKTVGRKIDSWETESSVYFSLLSSIYLKAFYWNKNFWKTILCLQIKFCFLIFTDKVINS